MEPVTRSARFQSNTLVLANLPAALFESSALMQLLSELLFSYGHLVSWTPLPAFGRCRAVFEQEDEAAHVKKALDRLILHYEHATDTDEPCAEPRHAVPGEEAADERYAAHLTQCDNAGVL